jgi:hypothetical protein
MEKTLKLGEKEYHLHSSLFTIIDYRNVFSTELFSDIKKLEKSNSKKEEDLSTVIDTIFLWQKPCRTILQDSLPF